MRTILDTSVLISSLIKGWWRQFADALHPNLILTSFFQYDTQAQSIGNYLRLRWTVRPGNDLFIVWNRNWQRLALTPNDVNIVPAKDSLTECQRQNAARSRVGCGRRWYRRVIRAAVSQTVALLKSLMAAKGTKGSAR